MAVSDEKKCSVLIAAITLRIEEHRSSSRALLSSPPRKNRYRLERSYDTLKIDTHLCYMYIGLRLIASPFSLLFFFTQKIHDRQIESFLFGDGVRS